MSNDAPTLAGIAAQLAALRPEIERVKSERDAAQTRMVDLRVELSTAQARIAELEAALLDARREEEFRSRMEIAKAKARAREGSLRARLFEAKP